MQIKVLGSTYPFPTKALTLGEQMLLKRTYGVTAGQEFDWTDPEHLATLLFRAMRQASPDATAKSIMQSIDRVTDIELLDDEGNPLDVSADDESDPTPPAAASGEESSAAPVSEPEPAPTGD